MQGDLHGYQSVSETDPHRGRSARDWHEVTDPLQGDACSIILWQQMIRFHGSQSSFEFAHAAQIDSTQSSL